MRPRIKTLPAPTKDPALAPVSTVRRATYWETTRPLGPESQRCGPRKSISPPHKRLQFRDRLSVCCCPQDLRPQVPALHVVLSPLPELDAAFPDYLSTDPEMNSLLSEIDEIITTCRQVLRVHSNSELKPVLRKAKHPPGESCSDRRRLLLVRRAEVSKSSRYLPVKSRKSLDSKDSVSPASNYIQTESCEPLLRGKEGRRSHRHFHSQFRDMADSSFAFEVYSPGKLRPVSKSPGAMLYLAKAVPWRPLSTSKRVIRRLEKLQTRDSADVLQPYPSESTSRRH